MNQFRRLMYGRYGFDQYTQAIVMSSLLISLVAMISRYKLIFIGSYLLLGYAIFRIVSKNIAKRSQENLIYCSFINAIKKKLRNLKLSLIGTKTHKFYKCSRCRQTIRVPRGKGRICISCPKCKTEFIKRT